MKKVTLAIPYNVLSFGEKNIGADARFWHDLEKDFRKLLLMRLENFLDDAGSIRDVDCILKSNIDAFTQITDLKNLKHSMDEALSSASKRKKGNPLRLFGLRLATLITPGERVYKKLEDEVNDKDINEIRSAHFLIRNLDLTNTSPLGSTKYFKLEAEIRGEDLKILDKIYSGIYKIDVIFKREFDADIEKCLNTSSKERVHS